jgi:dTDP-4-dehydrorhamnose 3,5-epimerase
MIEGVLIKKLQKYEDARGYLTEIYRCDELDHRPAMGYLSLTNPGIVRGPHEHRYQTDAFIFAGPGSFRLYLWDRRVESKTNGEKMELEVGVDNPCLVTVPPGVVHGYKCVSSEPAYSINLPDKLYKDIRKESEIDEIRWEGVADSPYKIS